MYYSKSALQVSGDVFAHHQEHFTVFIVSGSVHPSCCWLVFHSGHQPAATWLNTTRYYKYSQVLLMMGEIWCIWLVIFTVKKEHVCRSVMQVSQQQFQVCNSNFVSEVRYSQGHLGISVTKTTFRICEFLAAPFFSINTNRAHHRLYSPS